MLTPSDIRNPTRASGYNRVTMGPQNPPMFKARTGHSGAGNKTGWRGSYRRTAREAAQDYCDFINSHGGRLPAAIQLPTRRRRPERPQRPVRPDWVVEFDRKRAAWEREEYAKIDTQNFVYLVGMVGNISAVKVGESKAYEHRIATNNTFNPYELVVLAALPDDLSVGADKVLHRLWDEHRIDRDREWFRPVEQVLSHFGITRQEFLRRCGGTTQEVKAAA